MGALAACAIVLVAASGCGSFGAAEAPTSEGGIGLGDVAVEPPRPRDVRVEVGWPALADLDPAKDLRLTTIVVVVTDATDPSRKAEKRLGADDRGPYDFAQLDTSSVVDVTVELREASGRILGYGERRRWNLSTSKTVPVAARRPLLYFTSADRDDGQLRTFDLAPASEAEPKMKELVLPAFASLSGPRALYVTTDGLFLVQAGQARQVGGNGAAQLKVFDTGTHALTKTIPLKDRLSAAIPLGDGHRVLGAPAAAAMATTFALTDIDSATTAELPTGLQGGAITVAAIAASPDGARVAAVGSYASGGGEVPYAFTYDVGSTTVSSTKLSDLVDLVRGVRFKPDGNTIVVAGATNAAGWATGKLLFFTATGGTLTQPTRTILLEAGKTRVSSVTIDPDGTFAYVGNELRYTNGQTCCGDLRVIDLASCNQALQVDSGTSGPEFELLDATRLPYGAHRVIVGQSDNGNNVHGAFVELVPRSATPIAIGYVANGDIGSVSALTTPFGTRF